MSDASEMLAAALEQMDGIIAGNHIKGLKALILVGIACHEVWSHLEIIKLEAGK